MAKKNSILPFDPDSLFSDAVKDINKSKYSEHKPLDIISFAEKFTKKKLYPAQEIVLKWFYAGTKHNQNVEITDNDIEIIKTWDIDQPWLWEGENSKYELLKKYKNDPTRFFTDLVLVLGRRAGKSFMTALIATYEAYKLICIPDPQEYYGISANIWIINTASTKEQANSEIFEEIRKFINNCPVFDGRIGHDIDGYMWLRTDADLERNKKIEKYGGKPVKGSIVVAAGSSNSRGLRGHTAVMCIYDELAHFVEGESSQKSTSEEVYTALAPSCLTLSHKGEGRNIAISSPDLAQGFFFKHYNDAKDNEGFLLFQIPTWNANPLYPRDGQYISNAYKKDFERANAEYGARFRQAAGNTYFPHEKIDEAFTARDEWYKHKKGIPGYQYYMHLDPASSGDRYAVMIGHPETRYNAKAGVHQTYIIEDFSDFFVPPPGGYLDPDDIIDNHIFPLFEKFRIVSVTYDSMFSLEQQKKFNKKGITHRKISFAGISKNELYETTLDYFINNRIVLCRDDEQLKGELKAVLINYKKVPPKIMKNESAEFNTDDLVDCLCGLIHSISTGSSGHTKLPRVSTVRMGMR